MALCTNARGNERARSSNGDSDQSATGFARKGETACGLSLLASLERRLQSGQVRPILYMSPGVDQPGFHKQGFALRTGWKLRGFLSDFPAKRCDSIPKSFCLFGATPLHTLLRSLRKAGAPILSVAETAEGRAAIVRIWRSRAIYNRPVAKLTGLVRSSNRRLCWSNLVYKELAPVHSVRWHCWPCVSSILQAGDALPCERQAD